MLPSQRAVVVIPCLNEARAIAAVINDAKRFVRTVIVVDDGSTDDTSAKAEAAGAIVLRGGTTQGKGLSLARGFSHAQSLGFNWAICMDGDGQHSPGDLPRFLRHAEAGQPILVVGNRMGNPADMPLVRRLVNRLMSHKLSSLTGVHLPDTQCGYRLLHLPSWAKIPTHTLHFEFESELLVNWIAARIAVDWVPIEVIYGAETSKIHPLRDTIRWLKWHAQATRAWNTASLARPQPIADPV